MLGERVLGGLSREEARRQQTLKYKEDTKKFAEKEKEVDILFQHRAYLFSTYVWMN